MRDDRELVNRAIETLIGITASRKGTNPNRVHGINKTLTFVQYFY